MDANMSPALDSLNVKCKKNDGNSLNRKNCCGKSKDYHIWQNKTKFEWICHKNIKDNKTVWNM